MNHVQLTSLRHAAYLPGGKNDCSVVGTGIRKFPPCVGFKVNPPDAGISNNGGGVTSFMSFDLFLSAIFDTRVKITERILTD